MPVTAFTATATERVQRHIIGKLGLRTPLEIRDSFNRPNLFYRTREKTDVLSQISAKYGKTPAQGAIAWLLQTQGITAPIVGAKNGRQAQENLKAAGWQFSKEDYDVIDRASRRFMEGLPHYTLFFNTETTN